MPTIEEQRLELEALKLKLEADAKKRDGRQKFFLAFFTIIYPLLFSSVQYLLNVKQTADIETTQKEAAVEVKTELVAAANDVKKSVAEATAETDEQLDNIHLKVESANAFAAKDFYATEKLIEEMPPVKAAPP